MQTSSTSFLPHVQGVTWSEIKEGYPNLIGILFQLRLRHIIMEDTEALRVFQQAVDESPPKIQNGVSKDFFSPKDWEEALSPKQGVRFWFRMLEYIEKTEASAIAGVLGYPESLRVDIPGGSSQLLASTQKIYAALIEKSPWPRARWFRIKWQPEISIKMFSKHKLPRLPLYREQTGTTYVLRRGGGLDEDVIQIPPPSKPQTYKST